MFSARTTEWSNTAMPSLCIKELGMADMDAAAAVYRISYDERLPWLAGRHTPEEDKAFFRTRVIQNCDVWGASDLDRLVGFIAFRSNWIDQLYVLPDTQGRGARNEPAQDRADRLSHAPFVDVPAKPAGSPLL
jgi:putative acetyltransferase